MLTNFEKYNADMEKFEKSKLYIKNYEILISQIVYLPRLSKSLEKTIGIKGSEVRSLVRHGRQKGIPICSSNEGYYLAKTYEDVKETTAHLRERADAILITAAAMEKAWLLFGESHQIDFL